MALKLPLSNFSLDDVSTVFGSNTRPDRNLSSFHTKIFGNAGAGSKLSNFAGYGRPDCTLVSATTVDDDSIDVVFNISELNNLNASVRIEYHVDNGTTPFSGQSTSTTGASVYSSTGNKTIRVNNLNSSEQYWFRIRYYNDFNDNINDWNINLGEYETATTDMAKRPTPTSFNATYVNTFRFDTSWNYPEAFRTFVVEYRINFGSFKNGGLVSSSNWNNTTNPKSAVWEISDNVFFSSGDNIEVRLKCVGDAVTLDSDWVYSTFNA